MTAHSIEEYVGVDWIAKREYKERQGLKGRHLGKSYI